MKQHFEYYAQFPCPQSKRYCRNGEWIEKDKWFWSDYQYIMFRKEFIKVAHSRGSQNYEWFHFLTKHENSNEKNYFVCLEPTAKSVGLFQFLLLLNAWIINLKLKGLIFFNEHMIFGWDWLLLWSSKAGIFYDMQKKA